MTHPNFDIDFLPSEQYDIQFHLDLSSALSSVTDTLPSYEQEIPLPWEALSYLAASEVIGTPAQDAQFWQLQTTPFTCAVMAQCGIIESFTGQPISEAQLVYEADDLMEELTQGHKVIVGVDSGEIWSQDSPLEDFFQQVADHAIWVTGIDTNDPTNPKVIINDSGDPNGAGKACDMATFVDAWEDSGFFYVATDEAPPDFHLAASGFDPHQGLFR